ncbi:MAG: TIM-barrel domain-containing protein [Bacteroidota bacterium]
MRHLLTACLCILACQVWAQVTVSPAIPNADDTVTITYDATAGNKALMDYEGEVYVHTGVVTGSLGAMSKVKYVQGEWGTPDPQVKMTRIEKNKYQIRYHLRSFYGIELSEPFLQMSFLFRNADGSIVGKTAENQEAFYPELSTLSSRAMDKASGKDGVFLGKLDKAEVLEDNRLLLTSGKQQVVVEFYENHAVRVTLKRDPDRNPDLSGDLVGLPDVVAPKINIGEKFTSYTNGEYELRVHHDPLRIEYFKGDQQLFFDADGLFMDSKDQIMGLRMQLKPSEALYGTGSRALPMNRRGQRFAVYHSAMYGYEFGEPTINISLPILISSRGYALIFDTPYRGYFDLEKSERELAEFGAKTKKGLSYVIIPGDTPEKLVQEISQVTGKQPLPPRWALGYIQSRYGYKTVDEMQSTVEQLQAADYPLDAVILDLYWFGDKDQMGKLDWDENQFPNVEGVLEKLEGENVKVVVITEPYFTKGSGNYEYLDSLGFLTKNEKGEDYFMPDFWAGPGGLLDLTQEGARNWMWQFYVDRVNEGVDGFWCDLGEPERHPPDMLHAFGNAEEVHNQYPQIWNKMVYENHRSDFPDMRVFNLSRSGYIGMQRYATFPWSGDVKRSWNGFRPQPSIMLSMGMCGVGYMHSDAGGFTGAKKDPELYTRWMQFSGFAPIFRAHSAGLPAEPIFFPDSVQDAVRKSIKLRYQLLPYNYTLAWENSTSGTPMARPVMYYHPDLAEQTTEEDAYFWGRDLLVVPILEAGQKKKTVFLPPGKWTHFHSGTRIEGNRAYTMPVRWDHLPLLVREGAFIPMSPLKYNTQEVNLDTIMIRHYPSSANSSGTLYWDDGQNPDALKEKAYTLISFDSEPLPKGKGYQIQLSSEGKGFEGLPNQHEVYFTVYDLKKGPKRVTAGSTNLSKTSSFSAMKEKVNSFYFDSITGNLHVHTQWSRQDVEITLSGKKMF